MGDNPGLLGWAECNCKGPFRREIEGLKLERQDTGMGTEIREDRLSYIAGFEDGRQGYEPRMQEATRNGKIQGKRSFPRAFRRNQLC